LWERTGATGNKIIQAALLGSGYACYEKNTDRERLVESSQARSRLQQHRFPTLPQIACSIAEGVGQTCLWDIDGVDNGQLGAVHIDEGDVEGARLGRRQRQGQVHEGVKFDRGEVALRADQRGLVQPLHRVTRAHASENLLPVPLDFCMPEFSKAGSQETYPKTSLTRDMAVDFSLLNISGQQIMS
jgi:hypothetical protein